MSQEERQGPRPVKWRFRATLHILFGILYLVFAALVIFYRKFGTFELEPVLAYGLGALLALYGIFRIWRGWQDMQNSRDDQY